MSTIELDARRLLCPMPVIRVQECIKKLKADDILRVTVTDPGALHDVPAWCRIHGHEFLGSQQKEYEMIIEIKVCSTE